VISPDAVVCVACGTDQRTGSKLTTVLVGEDITPTTQVFAAAHDCSPRNETPPPHDDRATNLSGPKQNPSPHRGINFAIGFFGAALTLGAVIAPVFSGRGNIGPVIVAGSLLLVAMICAFLAGHRHIGFGILTVLGIVVSIPLLLLGACLGAANGCR